MKTVGAHVVQEAFREIPNDLVIDRVTSREIVQQLRLPSGDAVYRLDEFLPRNPNVLIVDLDKEFAKAKDSDDDAPFRFATEFERKYPDAWGYLVACRPAFSKDGKAAVVSFYAGPAYHAIVSTLLLRREGETWRVVWRYSKIYK
jgi:hypothetical protein